MGTSSIFNGRNDRNSLLPEDYNPNQDENIDAEKQVKWKTVKSDMSKYINSGGTYTSIKHIAKQYVRAAGGAKKLASEAYSGRIAAENFGNFFSGIINDGIKVTFKKLGVDSEGKSVEEIFSRLVDIISPNSNTKEDIVAKEATEAALSKIFDYVENNSLDIECLNKLSPELIQEALKEYVGSYIWINMMKDLGSRLEKYITNADDSYALESEFKDMITGIVDIEFNKRENIIDKEISTTIKEIHESCLKVMEGIV